MNRACTDTHTNTHTCTQTHTHTHRHIQTHACTHTHTHTHTADVLCCACVQVFGMKWVELKHPAQKSYILLNVLKMKEREELMDWCVTSGRLPSLLHVMPTTTFCPLSMVLKYTALLCLCLQGVQCSTDGTGFCHLVTYHDGADTSIRRLRWRGCGVKGRGTGGRSEGRRVRREGEWGGKGEGRRVGREG